jgi:tRNA dimethylallyltransferase
MASDAEGIRLLMIVGPTAVGKTALSIRLGRAFGGEVVSADSRQVYRGMDIGTAKATLVERAALPHHLIDIVDPDGELTLAHYQRMAADTIAAIADRGALPMLVGGTGLYVRAVTEGWTVPEVPPDPALRAELERQAAEQGHAALHARLAVVDPAAAQRIDARNIRRVIRALEVYKALGKPISALQNKANPGYRLCTIGLTLPRPALYERIDARVDRMMADGLVDEVRGLVARGYGYALPAMSALGYQQIGQYLRGEVALDKAVALIKHHTRRFVRQQYNWFRLSDPALRWFEASPAAEGELFRTVESFLTGAA